MDDHESGYHEFAAADADAIVSSLAGWYASVRRPLPWRVQHWDEPAGLDPSERAQVFAYHVWVSELMCQQTQVATAEPYFRRWTARWPRVADLAAATLEQVNEMWKGLGYYRRARFLYEGAVKVMRELGGRIPSDVDGLRALPGIGPYTAGAIASIAFARTAAVVDGNVVRVLARLRAIGAAQNDKRFWQLAATLVAVAANGARGDSDGGVAGHAVPMDDLHDGSNSAAGAGAGAGVGAGALGVSVTGEHNQAMMELGALVCTPVAPKCGSCPLSAHCRAFSEAARVQASAAAAAVAPRAGTIAAFFRPVAPVDSAAISCDSVTADAAREPLPRATKRQAASASNIKPTAWALAPSCELCASWPDVASAPTDAVTKYPTRKPKTAVRDESLDVFVLRDTVGRTLVVRRPADGLLGGLWELPSVPRAGAGDELVDELADVSASAGCAVPPGAVALAPVRHRFTHIAQTITPWLVELAGDGVPALLAVPVLADHAAACAWLTREHRWLGRDEWDDAAIATNMQKVIALVDVDKRRARVAVPTRKRKREPVIVLDVDNDDGDAKLQVEVHAET